MTNTNPFDQIRQAVDAEKCSACGDVVVPNTDLCSRCLHEWESNSDYQQQLPPSDR